MVVIFSLSFFLHYLFVLFLVRQIGEFPNTCWLSLGFTIFWTELTFWNDFMDLEFFFFFFNVCFSIHCFIHSTIPTEISYEESQFRQCRATHSTTMADSARTTMRKSRGSSSCMPFTGCTVRFLLRRPNCTLLRRRLGLRMIGRLLAPSASCVFPYLSASNLLYLACLTEEGQLSRSRAFRCQDWWLIRAVASCLFSWSL